ncbi:MAG: V-type ATP synthase subunit D [Candidatus Altiarchaeota archaeon]
MVEVVEGVHPTRTELLSVRRRIDLAGKGHSLLKEKRDALVIEVFEALGDVSGVRGRLVDDLGRARESLSFSESLSGAYHVDSVASASDPMPDLSVRQDNFMGVRIPRVDVDYGFFSTVGRNYGLADTPSVLDDAVDEYTEVLKGVLSLVEREEAVRRMCMELVKTKRRVNALEYLILPRLARTKWYIQMRLNELERENFARLKLVKKKREA